MTRRPLRCLLWTIAAASSLPTAAFAVCLSGHPSVAQEFKDSDFVITARMTGSREIISPDEAEGIDATIYRVRPTHIFKGRPAAVLEIYSENTSARFPMDKNTEYLLFIQRTPEGLSVSNCGNSDEAARRGRVIKQLRHSARN